MRNSGKELAEVGSEGLKKSYITVAVDWLSDRRRSYAPTLFCCHRDKGVGLPQGGGVYADKRGKEVAG